MLAPYGEDNYPSRLAAQELMAAGYIFVKQDVRGRNMSEGKFVEESPYKENKGPTTWMRPPTCMTASSGS